MIRSLIMAALCLIFTNAWAQTDKRIYRATRTAEAPVIDGRPYESVWDAAQRGDRFTVIQPENGAAETKGFETIIKVLYDDVALYVAVFLYDAEAEKISRQFGQRDEPGVQADLFSFWINTYHNQTDQTRFYITASGALADSKSTNGIEDFGYNVVFDAKTGADENGWYVEMKIPYQALRFTNEQVQEWSFNAYRKINRLNQTLSYNPIDIAQGNEAQYDAELSGIENIDPPFRLSLFPYLSFQSKQIAAENDTRYNAGVDIKYGITDAFTLDATLIPDFGQVGFDEVELNLSPFEQVFEERRPFFTEGSELLTKGNLFFSRRIGQGTLGHDRVFLQIRENEVPLGEVEQVQLLNAVKVTGRSTTKLGVGFLNALTGKTEITVLDTVFDLEREIIQEPMTNYNMIVLDQQYGANSSVYFSNANTMRSGAATDANVSALGVTHYDKSNRYQYGADLKMSNRYAGGSTTTGFAGSTRWQRVEGRYRYGFSYNYISADYDPNDLGLQFRNNLNSSYIFGSINQFSPKGRLNNSSINIGLEHTRTNSPERHNVTSLNINPSFQTRGQWNGGAYLTAYTRELDFFESRIPLQPVRYAPKLIYGAYLTSDTRKRLSFFVNANSENRIGNAEHRIDFSLSPSLRLTDRFFIRYRWFWQRRESRLSYVGQDERRAILSDRNTQTIENSIEAVYNIDRSKAVNIRLRNFWSSALFSNNLRALQEDGNTDVYLGDRRFEPNADFNVWNLDITFEWQFSAASSLVIFYRNNLSHFQNAYSDSFRESLDRLFERPAQHTFSMRLTYFLDANRL